jgi:polysaccharide biosynthesis transport protein
MSLLRKHLLWLVIAVVAGIVGGYLAYAAKSVAYSSTAQVDVEAHVIANTTPVAPNMATEKAVAVSGVVVDSVASKLGLAPGVLAKNLKSVASGTSNILSITCTMPTPVSAQNCASAAAAGYIAFRNDSSGSASAQAHDPLHATLVTSPLLPVSPAGLGKKILLPLGALLGLLLGVGAIFLRDHTDDRVRDRADLERCLEAPVLATVPRVPRRAGRPASIFARAPLSPAAEAYRHLRVRLEPIMSISDRGTVLLVASGGVREGRTSVAANLATALAYAGSTVILVDADLRRPSMSTVFDTGTRPGLTDLLAGRASVEEVAVLTDVPGLKLVTAGKLTDRSADMFEGNLLTRTFAKMRTQAEVVVVDSAPIRAISDAITLARISDITMVVADPRRTHRIDVSAVVQDLRAAEPPSIVGVLNNAPRSIRQHQARPSVASGSKTLAPASRVASALAASVPPRGPNGKDRSPFGPSQLTGHGPGGRGPAVGDVPTSPPDPD